MAYSDEQLMAYADGELPEAEASALRAAAQTDPQLAQRIERFAATRRVLSRALDARLAQPMPQRLLDVLHAPAPASRVIPLRRRPSLWRSALPLALAASLVLGVALLSGRQLREAPDSLSLALERSASGVPYRTAAGEIVALSSLRLPDGSYCREYEQGAASARSRGLACRSADARWSARAVAAVEQPASDGYQTADGEAAGVDVALGAERLSAQQELQLIASQWR